jgi:hypothetical protein
MKTDDDVHLRTGMLLDIIRTGAHNFSVDIPYPGATPYPGTGGELAPRRPRRHHWVPRRRAC